MRGAVEPFEPRFAAAELEDLRARLAATRAPGEGTVADWSQGVPSSYLRELLEYWREGYDLARVERLLAPLPQFRATVDGLAVHFLHLRSTERGATPLLLTHGWPSSVLEFLAVLGPLTEPTGHGGEAADAFHLVVPSLPGFAFSDAPTETGWGPDRISRAWAALMATLGYDRYLAAGGDWGSAVTRGLARNDPERLLGIHLFGDYVPRGLVERLGAESEFERRALAARDAFGKHGTGYSRQQATRPQTLAHALTDSPAGQCAWIVEKFAAWSDSGGDPGRRFSRETLLDTVTLYWLTGCAASAARIYWEAAREAAPPPLAAGGPPTAVSVFPADIKLVSERWLAAHDPNLVYYDRPPRGGHFAALEEPELYVEQVRAGWRAIRAAAGGPGSEPGAGR